MSASGMAGVGSGFWGWRVGVGGENDVAMVWGED